MNDRRTVPVQHAPYATGTGKAGDAARRSLAARSVAFKSVAVAASCLVASAGIAACSSSAKSTPSSTSSVVPGSATTGSAPTSPAATGAGASNSAPTASATTSATTSGRPSSGSTPTTVGPAGGAVPPGFVPYSSTWVNASDGWVLGSAPCPHAPCGSVVRTTDGGRSWKGIPAPKATVKAEQSLPSGGADILRFADRSNGWAAGRGLYATHSGGASWHRVSVGPSTGTVRSLEAGGGYVYALIQGCPPSGDGSCPKTTAVYAAKVGSDSWTTVSPTLSNTQNTQSLVVRGSSWFLPTSSGILVASGTAHPVTRPNPCSRDENGRGAPLITAADSTHLDALCAAGGGAGSTAAQLYGSTDGGRHWRKAGGLHKMVPGFLTGLADNAHGVLLISTASGGSYILRSTDDGRSLPRASVSAPGGGYGWADLGFTTSTQVSVTLPGHGLYLSRDAGRSFARVSI